MGRRRKGRDIHGWLIVDKPAGIGSTEIVGRLRRALDARKAGHAGTLDPAATGLLAVAFGEATKTIPYVTDAAKSYAFTVRFGAATSTDDAEGEVIASSAARPDDAAIQEALAAFRGQIEQVPPQVSAVRIGGERAYDLVRDGGTVEIAARPLLVERLEMIDRPDADHARLEMVCGKGGYVRSIARDLGAALGCHGHVARLRRLHSGPFDLADAVGPSEIDAPDRATLEARLRPLEDALAGLPRADVSAIGATRIANGNPGEVLWTRAGFGDTVWAAREGRALAMGTYRGGMFHPDRVLNVGPADAP